ncbi:hypothetical protein LINGRAHAP2_LOCUS14670 [Linum grandiflorum]
MVTIDCFLFSCRSTMMLSGLTSSVMRIIGFGGGGGMTQIALTTQFATAFGFQSKRFAASLLHSNNSGV